MNDTVDSMSEYINIEIDQKAQTEATQFQIRQYLCTVHRKHPGNCLHLNEDCPIHY